MPCHADDRACRRRDFRQWPDCGGYRGGTLSASAESISRDLAEYGEEDAATWVLTCSDDELVRLRSVADWLLFHGPARPSGGSMIIAKACALAAVYVREGAPRELARSRRRKLAGLPPMPSPERRPSYQLQQQAPREYGVGDDARSYWSN